MKRFFSCFSATLLYLFCGLLCVPHFRLAFEITQVMTTQASTNQASALQADENQNAESGDATSEQSTSDEANDGGNVDTQSSYKSHYFLFSLH